MKYIPKIKDFYLDIADIRDNREYAVVSHEYPYTQLNKIENMGTKTKSIHVECSFQDEPSITKGWSLDDGYYPTFEAHQILLQELDNNLDSMVFIHPIHGEMNGHVQNIGVLYDDTPNFALVSFDFLQEVTDDSISFIQYVIPETAKNFRDSTSRMMGVIEKAQDAAASLGAFQNKMATFRGVLQAKLNQITSPATSIENTVNYTTALPGLVVSDINAAFGRITESFVTVTSSPNVMISSLLTEIKNFKNTFTDPLEQQYVQIMGASRLDYESAIQYEQDQTNRNEIINIEEKTSFDANGNYKKVAVLPEVMTIDDLDNSLAEVKTYIESCVQLDREFVELKKDAALLQKYINSIKLDREKIITRNNLSGQTLHSILLREGINYQKAERILALNPEIKNPAYINGSIKLIVSSEAA